MKLKHLASTMMMVLAAFAAVPSARATTGDIFEIRPISGSCTAETAMSAEGDKSKFSFVVRMLARDWDATTWPPLQTTPTSWALTHIGLGSEMYDAQYYPFQIGIIVSGRLRFADVEVVVNDTVGTNGAYTDLICSYKVQPGDLALPVRLALAGSTEANPIAAGSTDADGEYYFRNSDKWTLTKVGDTSVRANFRYCPPATALQAADDWQLATGYTPVTDIDLYKASFYVKSIRLGASADDTSVWSVGQGASAKFTVTTIGTPTEGITLYAWAEKEDAFKVSGNNESIMLPDSTTETRSIYELNISPGKTDYTIPVKGVAQGKDGVLILSPTKGAAFNAAGAFYTNYLYRAVTCVEPPPPSISFTFDGDKVAYLATASTNDVADINDDGIKVTVTLSEPFGKSADIQIKAGLVDDPFEDVFAKTNLVGVAVGSNAQFPKIPVVTNITMSATDTTATFYVYPLGGNENTSSGGILFEPVLTNTTLSTTFKPENWNGCTLRIKDTAPTIIKPTSADKLSGTSDDGCKIPIEINDSYSDMLVNKKFDVAVDFSDSGHYEISDVIFKRNVATNIVATGFSASATWARITVTDKQGNQAFSDEIPLTVPKEKTVSAELLATSGAEKAEEGIEFDEGKTYYLRFRLGPDEEATKSLKDMYAFLLPMNAASSNLVETTATTNGVFIKSGNFVSTAPSTIKFLDGSAATANLRFKIVLRDGASTNDTVVAGYKSEDLYLQINNVAPNVASVTVGDAAVSNGGTATIPAYAGQNIDLTITAYDPVAKDLTEPTGTDCITAHWTITDGDDKNPYTYTTNTVFDAGKKTFTLKHPFNTANRTQTVTVKLQDKDMADDEWGPEYTFKVNVKDAPSVKIFDWNGNDMAAYYPDFMEINNGTGAKNPYVTIELSPAPLNVTDSDPIVVKLNVTNLGDGSADVATNYVYLTAVKPSAKVFLKDLNGINSSNFEITGVVTNINTETKIGKPWNKYYDQAVGQFSVSNIQPLISAITGASESITNSATLGTAKTLTVTVSDVSLDVGSENFKIVWTDELGIDHYSTATNYNVYGSVTNSVTASWEFTPKNEGTFTISVAIDDGGSNGRDERMFWFYVKPTKFLTTAASGPSSGDSLIGLSRLYRSQDGIGKGRTYVTGKGVSATPTAKKFKLEWNCGTAYTANLWAYGYRWGDEEGSLSFVDAGDVDLDANGDSWTSGTHYTYAPSDLRDSFFYGWIKPSTPGEKDYQISVNPEDGTFNVGDGELELPAELGEDEVGYKPTYAEAVFATEWEYHDNLGDIDQDGVPDIFALKAYSNGALATADGAGGELGSGAAGNNNDGDFYPAASHLGDSPLLPGATSGWATSGTAFDAMREIRGYDDGLNYGMFKVNTTERDAGWVSDLSLSDNEKRSLIRHALARRDEILHERYYEAEMDDYWEKDWIAITNLLRTLVRVDTTRKTGAVPVYYTEGEVVGGTIPGTSTETVTNTYEKWGATWETEDQAFIQTYSNSGKKTVAVTNLVHTITNIIDTGSTVTTNIFVTNPYDSITLDDINFTEFLSGIRTAKPSILLDDHKAARAYIDRTWHLYDEYGTWGWTCENRTDPTTDDTDGDGLSDGYEYFLWYDAMVGVSGSNRLAGCKFNLLKPDSRDDVIKPETIASLYNPNIKRSWTSADTDGDGLADLEEFLIGTSPIDWDTDLDGVSDFYELAYNLNPLSSPAAKDGGSNNDGDYMAYVKASAGLSDSTVPKMEDFANLAACTYVFTATNGTLWMLDYDATPDIWAALRADPETNAVTVVANGFEVAEFCGNYIPPTESTASLVPVSRTVMVDPLVPVVTNTVSLYHHQVHNYFGFDPRTAWFRNPSTGNCSGRFGDVYGKAVNTTAFTAKDEYMLLRYRYLVGLRDHAKDLEDIKAGKATIRNVILAGTTNPNPTFEAKTWGDSETSYSQSQHGADTDGDAVPDGWELYLGVNPNKKYTIAKGSSGYDELYWDGGKVWPAIGLNEAYDDGLELATEFAGTDTSGAHSACPTIYANHPDNAGSAIKGWVNKYMPTDPRNKDTDGDGLDDGKEGKNWAGSYTINRWGQDNNRSKNTSTISGVQYHIIYGNPKASSDSPCVRGGGLNPCSIDTDSDGLPDLWEHQNAGLLFLNDEIATEDNSGEGVYVFPPLEGLPNASVYDDIRAAVSALGWDRTIYTNDVYHIIMGMDGTSSDAYTKTGLKDHDLDWDGDGLQNWQEYMVQAMRQFRYDDDRTPLMGRDIPKFNTATGKMDPGSWNGDKGYLKISRALPVTTEQHKALDELGYSNFVDYVSSNPDYLRKLGYFAAPPRTWDQASGCLYMLPPSCTKVAGSNRSVTSVSTPVVDGAGSTVWGYAQSFDDYDFTIEEPDYLAIGWQTVTNTVAGPEAFYDSSLGIGAYTDGQVLLHTNGVPFAYYVVVDTTALKLYPVMQLVNTTTTETYTPSNVVLTAGRYVGTDPRLWDTDEDGMDDYWELFHGLNPILGYVGDGEGTIVSNGTFTATLLTLSNAKDIIYNAYGSVSAWRNGWIGWDNIERPTYDPIRYPWMMGEGLCDADGDGLRNEEEALAANLTEPLTYHTDPTPLWMTDATGSYTNRSGHLIYDVVTTNGDTDVSFFVPGGAGTPSWSVVTNTYTNATASVTLMSSPSYTGLFYDYAALLGGATGASATGSNFGFSSSEYAFSFEQNEGYDTDNDWRSDSIEMKNTVEGTSDPLDVGDVQRRQSLWFGGSAKPGAAISYTPTVRNVHAYDLFRQFTVEAWVRSENPASGADQYIVSRASNYPGWDVSHTNGVIRMNFALGVDATGKAFAEMQDSAEATFRLEGSALSPNVWTHVAASYDGSTFKVYVNGEEMASTAASLMPANGVTSIQQDPQYSGAFPYEEFTYNVAPSITILGARACGEGAFDVKNAAEVTGWGDVATDFFKGSVSEVRMWDGARKPADIAGDFKVRYTTAKVKELRDTVCAQYIKGARRNTGDLDTELVQHYGMDSLPGGTEEKFVQLVPAGFKANVLDAVRNPDTGAVTTGDELAIGWWSAIVTNATLKPVYSSPHVVPWVENTVGHLPKTCGAVADSVYWSEHFAGYTPAAFHELDSYSFANTMDPYGVVNTRDEARYSYQKYNKLVSYPGGGATSDDNRRVYRLERYDSNKGFSGTTDLLPLGSAFAKRLTESWDGMGVEDAWATTTSGSGELDGDPNDTGIPSWVSTATYPTPRDYARALAKGLLPDGVNPSYENTADLDGDGMRDWWEKFFGIYDEGPNDDHDRDGLSNYQEYLIGEVYTSFGFTDLSPTAAYSKGTAVTDYFLRYGSLYLGELFSDHDMIEDSFEDYKPSVISLGGTLVSNFSRWIYDADWDAERDGWDNWSIARAWFNESYTSNVVVEVGDVAVTNEYLYSKLDENNGNPNPEIPIRVTYRDSSGSHPALGNTSNPHQFVVKAWSLANGAGDDVFGAPDCAWGGNVKGEGGYYWLEGTAKGYSASQGAIKPGRNMFVAYIAEGEHEDGAAAPAYETGMPYGVTIAEVGPIGGANINIELTDTNPSVVRINVPAVLSIQSGDGTTALVSGTTAAKEGFATASQAYTDRGCYEENSLAIPAYIGKETTLTVSNIHVRVLRAAVNGLEKVSSTTILSSPTVLLDRHLKVGISNMLTEADLLAALPSGTGDLDWGGLATACQTLGSDKVTNATYRIVVGDGTVASGSQNNNLMVMFINKFEPVQTPVADMSVRTFAGRPTFSWSHNNTIGKDYPAFQLRVWDATTDALVYDSGVQRAPVRDQSGCYNWSAPLYVGALLPNGQTFSANTKYKWSVSMLDAKFTTPNSTEVKKEFAMQATSPGPDADDYGIIKVAVKYMGPGTVATSTTNNRIRVEAFTTPDFVGEPAGVGYVTDATTLKSVTAVDVNATIVGLPVKDNYRRDMKYYVRAFLDTDVTSTEGGFGKRAPWESWGYASYRDPKEGRDDCFTAMAMTATNNENAEPCVVFIEDCDTNRNMVPDILEKAASGTANKLVSPYIAFTASDLVKTNALNDATNGANGNVATVRTSRMLLAYASAVESAKSGTVTAGELAILTGAVSFDTTDSTYIKIKSFSLDEGISLEVVVGDTFDNAKAAGLNTGVINVTVEYSETLDDGGDWQKASGSDTVITFPLTLGTTTIDASELDAIKTAIESVKATCEGGCYFRVSAVAVEE